jgi:hypothetical protein
LKKSDWILIALIGLILQGFWAWQLTQPTYMDSYYYTTNGQRLASGYGFTEMIVWQYLDDPISLPTPSHTYWMPLPSILAAAGYSLRDDFSGSQLLFWLLGGLLPLLAYAISWQLSGKRWQAWVSALFVAVGGFYAAFMSQPSTFAPFAWAAGLGLLALGMATAYRSQYTVEDGESHGMIIARQRLWWLIAGLMAGLAHLTRADGFLLLLVGLLIWALATIKRPISSEGSLKKRKRIVDGIAFSFLGLLLLGYVLTMGWWLVRNWLTLGRLLPTAGAQSAFLTTYDDLFAYGRAVDLKGFLDWGASNILLSKIQGASLALQTFVAIPGLIFLVPFIIVALIFFYRHMTTRLLIRPVIIFGIALSINNALIFTLPGSRGSLFHSSIALWPWSTALAAAGIGLVVDWVATKLPHWQPERAKKIFSGLFILVAVIMTLFLAQSRLKPDTDPELYLQVGEMVSPSSVVMVGNAPALHYYSGLPAITVPNEAVDSVLDAADRFGVTHVLLNQNRPLPLEDIYQGKISHPRLSLIWSSDDVRFYEVNSPDR